MAGNIVKWWKHKIFGGYKQFSVLQECTTDSEELMYHQVRAPSTCSAPPDLLLVSDIENIVPIKSSTQITNHQTTPTMSSSTQQHHQEQSLSQNHHQYQHPHSNSKGKYKNNNSPLVEISNDSVPIATTKTIDATGTTSSFNGKPTKHSKNCTVDKEEGENSQEEKMHLEEFTCDVSVENGKSSQPLQFSFTFYDLDGHHGKITKDDIVGIVYTIYESIGKSVVVPHCGSKTINVRLTVSPEGKSKANNNNCKLKKSTVISKLNCHQKTNNNNNNNNDDGDINVLKHHQHNYHHGHPRRQHRYRPRKLVKTDDEEDDTASDKDQNVKTNFYNKKYGQMKNSSINNCQSIPGSSKNYNQNENLTIQTSGIGSSILNNCKNGENIYSNKNDDQNIKVNSINVNDKSLIEGCEECAAAKTSKEQFDHAQQFLKRAKILRKSRKHKDQIYESRQRSQSMSACNDRCWSKRFNEKKIKINSTQNTPIHQQQQQPEQSHQNIGNQDTVDGIVSSTTTTPTQKSWNNALKRNELIDIIRESMEKNRLCFQSNGKSQTNMSPVRHHRQRSNTVSKITTDLKKSNPINYNHLYGNHQFNQKQLINTNNDITGGDGIHVPIYHQQLLTNIQQQQQQKQIPIEKGFKNHKVNLCGYDSFLHATICGGNSHHNHNDTVNSNVQNLSNHNLVPKIVHQQQQQQQQQQQSTLDIFMNQQQSPKIYINNSNIIKTNKHLRQQNNGINGDNPQQQQQHQNSPPFYGYQRLNSSTTTCNITKNYLTTKFNQKLLKEINPDLNSHEEQLNHTIYHVEKWLNDNNDTPATTNNKINDIKLMKQIYHNTIDKNLDEINKKDVKNYDNLLYSKLNDKLITSTTTHNKYNNNPIKYNLNNKENIRKIKNHQQLFKQQYRKIVDKNSTPPQQQTTTNVCNNKFDDNLIPIFVNDPIECENLIPLITSDEESTTPRSNISSYNKCKNDNNKENRNSSSSSSSTIHRYVHEHIHHHYHHFENKEED